MGTEATGRPPGQPPRRLPAHPGPGPVRPDPARAALAVAALAGRGVGHARTARSSLRRCSLGPLTVDAIADWLRGPARRAPACWPGCSACWRTRRAGGWSSPRPGRTRRMRWIAAATLLLPVRAALAGVLQGVLREPAASQPPDRGRAQGAEPAGRFPAAGRLGLRPGRGRSHQRRGRGQRARPVLGRTCSRPRKTPTTSSTPSSWPSCSSSGTQSGPAGRPDHRLGADAFPTARSVDPQALFRWLSRRRPQAAAGVWARRSPAGSWPPIRPPPRCAGSTRRRPRGTYRR